MMTSGHHSTLAITHGTRHTSTFKAAFRTGNNTDRNLGQTIYMFSSAYLVERREGEGRGGGGGGVDSIPINGGIHS